MMNIKTYKLTELDEPLRGRAAEFARCRTRNKFRYITLNPAQGLPFSRHIQWWKARDKVLKERPALQLVIIDCAS